jgi:hypothetical protein
MVNVKSKKCEFKGCTKHPVFNLSGEKQAKYCETHKENNMINIKSKKCEFEGCIKQPAFNLEGEKQGKYCLDHKKNDMINVVSKQCEFEGCTKQPVFNLPGEITAKYCTTHKEKKMINVKDKRCIYCCDTLVKNPKYEGYCLYCFMNLFPDKPIIRNYKIKEKHVADYLFTYFKKYIESYDRQIKGGCSKKRVELFFKYVINYIKLY